MLGSEAITRIKEGLGFISGTHHDTRILKRLQEAQRDFEAGKTLPKFLVQQDQTLALTAGLSSLALPTGFLGVFDEEKPHFLPEDSNLPVFLERKFYSDAVLAYQRFESGSTTANSGAPKVYVIRKSTIDFVFPADQDYTITWSYYKAADIITTDAENAWLANASEWLIGEAGHRMAKDVRDGDAIQIFDDMAKKGRTAVFSKIIDDELKDGPLQMGAQN